MLYPDEAANFRTDFFRYLVKLGVIGDGSCFIHSLLLATDDSYDNLSEEERKNSAAEFRGELADSFDMQRFEALSNGNLAIRLYHENFVKIFEGLRKRFEGEKHVYGKLLSAVPIDDIAATVSHSDSPPESVVRVVNVLCRALGTNKHKMQANELIGKIAAKARSKSYEGFIARLRDPAEFIDEELFTAIAAQIDRDVYIFHNETRQPYQGLVVNELQKDLSIFLVYSEAESHYELLGLVDHMGDYSVQFTAGHPLVAKTREVLGYESVDSSNSTNPEPEPLRSPRAAMTEIEIPVNQTEESAVILPEDPPSSVVSLNLSQLHRYQTQRPPSIVADA